MKVTNGTVSYQCKPILSLSQKQIHTVAILEAAFDFTTSQDTCCCITLPGVSLASTNIQTQGFMTAKKTGQTFDEE